VAILREHRRSQAEERLAASLMTKLINRHNNADPPPAKALPHAGLHHLRHLHATILLLAGVPVRVVAARLRHAHPAVTLQVY
jgi:integrase